MRSVLKQDNRSGILILGRVVQKGEDEERHVLQSSRQGRFSFDETKEEFSEINSNHSCIFKTCLRLVGCVICSLKAVAMALVILQFCQGAKAAKIEKPHL